MPELPDLRDADGREWPKEELQTLVIQVGSFKDAATRLGLPAHVATKMFRERDIMPPSEFVRSIAKADPIAFRDSVIREGSVKEAATYYKVSVSHLKTVFDEVGIKHRRETPTPEEAQRALDVFGSAILAARLLGTTPTEIKRACPEWKDFRDPLKTGRHAITTGRIGEDYWKELRGPFVLEETAYNNPNAPDYDFIDQEYGRTNVKTSNPTQEKSTKLWSWTWEVNPKQDAETFPLVYLDRNRFPVGLFLVEKWEGKLRFPPDLRVTIWANGCYGVSIKATSDRPTTTEWIKEES